MKRHAVSLVNLNTINLNIVLGLRGLKCNEWMKNDEARIYFYYSFGQLRQLKIFGSCYVEIKLKCCSGLKAMFKNGKDRSSTR